MSKSIYAVIIAIGFASSASAANALPAPSITDLKNPESVAVSPDGRVFVSCIGEFDKNGDGTIVVIENGKARTFATGLDDPKGIGFYQDILYVADKNRVWRITKDGEAFLFAPPNAFPTTPLFLNDLVLDSESGTIFVSDSGDLKGNEGAVYRISPKGLVDVVINKERLPQLNSPNGLALDGASHLLLVDFGTGFLHRIKLATGVVEKISEGFVGADGLCWDRHGRLYISNWKEGTIHVIPRPGAKPILHTSGLKSAADLCLSPIPSKLLVPDMLAGTLTEFPAQVPGALVDETPLPLTARVAFPNLVWDGWQGETDSGKIVPFRPIILTHAGDGSNRIFVASQHGVIYSFADDDKATSSKKFLDIQERVRYLDDSNEEGFLGLAFHPKFKENGEFFVFYTPKKGEQPHTNYISRFRVNKDHPEQANPASEEVLLKVDHPFWNHDGGTIAFGPDGMLYIALGDGGAGNDPFGNAQDMSSILGKILRIDVDKKEAGRNYAIPADNPFANPVEKKARPEIWASGLRNVWRLAFDRKEGTLWAADVGQNLYEEINIITRGGNYGWNIREATHPFGARGVGPRKDLIDPIWEYHHDSGRSITGGGLYRGKKFPELVGSYLYADYITGAVSALRYDARQNRVVANQPIAGPGLPILSFGEDEQGEFYFMIVASTGKGIYRFERKAAQP